MFIGALPAWAAPAGNDQVSTDTEQFQDLMNTAWQLYTHYRWTNYLSFQSGYSNPSADETSTRVANINEFLVSANRLHPHSFASFEPAMVGRYPMTERLSVLGRGGVLYWETKNYDNGNDIDLGRLKDRGSDFFLGAGVECKLYKHWNLNADWTGYKVGGERTDVFGLGLSYRLKFK